MSNRWPAGIIRKNPVTPAGPLQNGAASGVWSLADAAYWTKQGLWPTAGNFLAVEDVFSTYLYTGNGVARAIENGINLSGQGGLVWIKPRDATGSHLLRDTVRGGTKLIISDSTGAEQTTDAYPLGNGVQFNSNGFSLGPGGSQNGVSGFTFASWTFREAPNFFDVVTYTGDGANSRDVSHSLGVKPGFILIKRTNSASDWAIWHRGNGTNAYSYGALNSSGSIPSPSSTISNLTSSTTFRVGDGNQIASPFDTYNINGATYVAYLYAHDTASTGLIQCGSLTANNNNPVETTLGWEPQWLLFRNTAGGSWQMADNMRGLVNGTGNDDAQLLANSTSAESLNQIALPTATGFISTFFGTSDYIYMAIRRGPMRTPTLGTSVFMPWTRTGTGTTAVVSSTTFPPDLLITQQRSGEAATWFDRLRGRALSLISNSTGAEATTTTATNDLVSFNMNGITVGANQQQAVNTNGAAIVDWNFRRAPSFFDEVCWTNTGATQNVNHNLGVVPELIITKRRPGADGWQTYSAATGASAYLVLNTTAAPVTGNTNRWNATAPTSTVFTTGSAFNTAETYVAYLFASCPGVSKVGSYTGNGSSQTINCAFTTGSRFVMIKRTDSTGDWFVWDSARGIVAGNDPYLALNTTAAEVTTNDSVDTDNTGFIVNQVAASNVNVNAATYIFLAIA